MTNATTTHGATRFGPKFAPSIAALALPFADRTVLGYSFALLLAATPVPAQAGTSTIWGVVKHAAGAALPGVTVAIVNEDTGISLELVTNEQALYRATALVPGTYRVESHLQGFQPSLGGPIVLAVGQTIAVDFTLDLERQQETVDVVAAVPIVEAQSSNVTQTITRDMLGALQCFPWPAGECGIRASSSMAATRPTPSD